MSKHRKPHGDQSSRRRDRFMHQSREWASATPTPVPTAEIQKLKERARDYSVPIQEYVRLVNERISKEAAKHGKAE